MFNQNLLDNVDVINIWIKITKVRFFGIFNFEVQSLFKYLLDDLSEEARSDEFNNFDDSEQFKQEKKLQVPKFLVRMIILVKISGNTFDNKYERKEGDEFQQKCSFQVSFCNFTNISNGLELLFRFKLNKEVNDYIYEK